MRGGGALGEIISRFNSKELFPLGEIEIWVWGNCPGLLLEPHSNNPLLGPSLI